MRRSLATALGTVLLLSACASDGDPTGPREVTALPLTPGAVASGVTVRADTLPRAIGLDLGFGVSDAGGIPVKVLGPTGAAAGGVWNESGVAYLPGAQAAFAITAAGDVLGFGAAGTAIWRGTSSRIVGQGGAALNDRATVVVGRNPTPMRWKGGVTSALKHPGGNVHGLFPSGVNNTNTAVGVGIITSVDIKAVRWDGLKATFLPQLAPGGAHGALAIDNAGRIVGYSSGTVDGMTGRFPVMWDGGAPRPLATLPGVTPFGNAQNVHENGDIVGFLRTASGEDHAMLWRGDGELIDLGASLPGFSTYARGINASGVVSGVAYPPGANPDLDFPILVRWTIAPAPVYTFDGFFGSVASAPALNVVKGGKGVPVRFSVGGDHGLDVFQGGYPQERSIACDPGAAQHPVAQPVTTKASSLTFDPATERYTYLFKTRASWAGGCRELVIRLSDGQERSVRFKLGS